MAPKLGFSDVGLAKLCRRLGIPKPGVGHWEKVRHGKRMRRPALPDAKPGQEERIVLGQPSAVAPERSERVRAQRAYEDEPSHRIVVRDSLRGAHPLVIKTRDALEARRKLERSDSSDPRVRLWEAGCLDVHVSSGSAHRALRIYDAVIRACEARGFRLHVEPDRGSNRPKTFLTVFSEQLAITVEEASQAKARPPRYSWQTEDRVLVPTGELSLRIDEYLDGGRKNFRDGVRAKLEDRLGDFMVAAVAASEVLCRRREEREEQERLWREAAELRRLEEARIAAAAVRRTRLRAQASAWSQAQALRAFIAAVEAHGAGPDDERGEALTEWLRWARSELAALDPLGGGGASLPNP